MNNEYKNLGVAFGLSSIIEGLSLTKIQIPSTQGQVQSLYQIKSEDGSIDYTINLNDEDFAINSSEILRDVLEWTYQSIMGFYTNMPASNEQDENENILKIINLLKEDARESIAEIDINRGTEMISEGEYKLRRTESGIYEFQDSIFGSTQNNAPDFKICEYALTFLCEIYGDTCLDRNKIFTDCTLEDWEKTVEETEDFLDEVTTLTIDNTLDYLRYKQAREDYQNNYAEDSYTSKIKDILGLPDGEFPNRLADEKHPLFGEDVLSDIIKKLQNLADLLDDTKEPLDDHDHHDDGLGAK